MATALAVPRPDRASSVLIKSAQSFFVSPFFFVIFGSLLLTVVFYGLTFSFGATRGVILGTTLFAQVHFALGYAFGFNRLKEKLGSSGGALGVYALLLGGTVLFYSGIQSMAMEFWGLMIVLGYFFFHYYENILHFWDTSFGSSAYPRRPLYFLMSAASFLVLFPLARLYGPQFAGAAISYHGVNDLAFLLAVAAIILSAAVFFLKSADPKAAAWAVAGSVGAIVLTTFIASRFLNFLGIVYFNTIWHFFMWHLFYLWKLWRQSPGLSLVPPFAVRGRGLLNPFLAYATSGAAPFLAVTALIALPVAGYFVASYDGARATFLFHPFYGQFAMYAWTLPHITLSFIFRR